MPFVKTTPHRDRQSNERWQLEGYGWWQGQAAVEVAPEGIRLVGDWPALCPEDVRDLAYLLLRLAPDDLLAQLVAAAKEMEL